MTREVHLGELFGDLAALARRHLNPSQHDTDDQLVFAVLVEAVRAYSQNWERQDLERGQRNAERVAQHLPPEPGALSDLSARPRWELALEAIRDNIEYR